MRALLALAAIGAGGLIACAREETALSPAAQQLIHVVRDVAADVTVPVEDPEALPIVYVVSATDEPIRPKVQASVANALNGEVDIRFADERAEAIDAEKVGAPVHDGGALVAVGSLQGSEPPVELPVEVYWSERDFRRQVVMFGATQDEWSVTGTTILEELNEPPPAPDGGEGGEDGAPDDPEPTSPAPPSTSTP